ncbi:hypothetical protein [Novosphingobium guangzhouense]|uniref:Uncharacterized protein n=1 Tax=Novosphingobium guangzhouense TaxID=1850347 RepID=A0A2K2FVG4_9SPHN|nr:hypothetical protein [Novosphingobium guangzhouense]PNU02766.1 hypothetical protein A8V01_25505 [Novosphingobium guangzhouense]
MSAEVHIFPREGFLLGSNHCGKASEDRQSICLGPKGHCGEHKMVPWEGFRVRSPWNDGTTIPFRGFAG